MTIALTNCQQDALKNLQRFWDARSEAFVLSGYAGAGKSFTLGQFLKSIPSEYVVAMLAPTHKAAAVLGDVFKDAPRKPDVIGTIHSFLKLKPKWERDRQIFVQDKNSYVQPVDLIIVDECSMLDEQLLTLILNAGAPVVFVGDPAQLFPVSTDKLSAAFSASKWCVFLDEVVRQASGSPILSFATKIRQLQNDIPSEWPKEIFKSEKSDAGVLEFLPRSKWRQEAELSFRDPTLSTIILAHSNQSVVKANSVIRRKCFDRKSEFEVGELLVLQEPLTIEDEDDDAAVLANNNDIVRIVGTKLATSLRDFDGDDPVTASTKTLFAEFVRPKYRDGEVGIWLLDVEHLRTGSMFVLPVIRKSDVGLVAKIREDLKLAALRASKKESSYHWRRYYRCLRLGVDVKFSHASTVHKSQGSTFDVTFLDAASIVKRDPDPTTLRLLYTAATRPRKRLAVTLEE